MPRKKKVPAEKASTDVTKYDYGDHAGKGYEHQTREDVAIPFLAILQKLSPQIDTIMEAKPGLLFNTVTEEIMTDVLILPVSTHHVYVEWIPRVDGGGFVAVHALDSPVVAEAKDASTEFGKYKVDGGHDLVETFYIYVVICDKEKPLGLAVMAFSSTKIKVYKRTNTRWQTFMLRTPEGNKIRPPMFSHLTRVTTVQQENKKGQYFNFVLEPVNKDLKASMVDPQDPRFQMAAEFHQLINDGAVRIAYDTVQQETAVEEEPIPF